jgi:hypothetical protein
MSLNIVSYVFLLMKEGIDKTKKSKGGLVGSITRPVAGKVCYRLVLEPQVETPGWYGPGLLVSVSWLRLNSDREIENLRRNGVVEATEET